MRKILVTILIFILSISLCVNFARYMFFDPSQSATGQFVPVSSRTVIKAFADFKVDDNNILNDLGIISKELLNIGDNYWGLFHKDSIKGSNIFETVKNFFVSIYETVNSILDVIFVFVRLLVDLVRYLTSAVFAIFRFLNTLLGFNLITS